MEDIYQKLYDFTNGEQLVYEHIELYRRNPKSLGTFGHLYFTYLVLKYIQIFERRNLRANNHIVGNLTNVINQALELNIEHENICTMFVNKLDELSKPKKDTFMNLHNETTIMVSGVEPEDYDPKKEGLKRDMFIRFYKTEDLEHALEFLKTGSIKVNSLKGLRELESERIDKKEGIVKDVFIDKKNLGEPDQYFFGGLMKFPDIIPVDIQPKVENVYTYCVSYIDIVKKGVKSKDELVKILREQYKCDRYAVLITDIQRFMNAMKRKFTEFSDQHFYIGLVKYQETTPFDFISLTRNDSFFREVTFTKDNYFKSEYEFRFAIEIPDKNQMWFTTDITPTRKYAFILDLDTGEEIKLSE